MLTLLIAPTTAPSTLPTSEEIITPTEYNGLPVVRTPKELGRRGLTNKNIIQHPSGFKLSKVPNGYIILCTHPDCGNIGSKDDIKCIHHAETYRHCRHPGCDKRAYFGYEARKSLYCSDHKHDDMLDVIHKKCASPGCDTLPYFGYPGGSNDYCSRHKLEGMVDVIHKKCLFPGCNKAPSYGNQDVKGVMGGKVPEYCSEHRPTDAVDVKHKRCTFVGCGLTASFGLPGGPLEFCGKHRSDGMFDNKKKKCLSPDCLVSPSFAFPGETSKYCKRHKLDGMINVRDRTCLIEQCQLTPCFGFDGGKMEYCNRHKLDGMINIHNKKCEFPDCGVQARFGYTGQIARFCSEHKIIDMINLRDKKCKFPDCNSRPSLCPLFALGTVSCKSHASLNEYSYFKRNPICHELKCRNRALFIDSNDTMIYPVRCPDHCLPTDIELVQRICPNCEDEIYYPSNQDVCMECGQYRDIFIISLREEAVERLLVAHKIDFVHDKRVYHHGSRHRPDFLIPSSFGYIIVEVDENQHNKHLQIEEDTRMRAIYQDVQFIAPGKQVLFLRYNPDKYDSPYLLDDKQRLEYLHTVITSMIQLPSLGISLGYVKLFYDGFNGRPSIQPLHV
jgi:hypothetical protein